MHAIQVVAIGAWAALQMPFAAMAVGMTGWYSDTGYGQTILREAITIDNVPEMQRHFIDWFGLPQRLPNEPFASLNRSSAPNFLFNIYRQLSEPDQHAADDDDADQPPGQRRRRRRSADDSDAHARLIADSDTIMTIAHNGDVHPLNERLNGTRLAFDLSTVPLHDSALLMAELHLYKASIFQESSDADPCVITVHASRRVDG